MTSRERMLATLEYRAVDYIPCSFMLFHNLYRKVQSEREYVERQLDMGLDAHVYVGHLRHSLHPDAQHHTWTEERNGEKAFCRRIDTPAGPLTGRVRQRDNWPHEDNFPLFDDWIVTRAEEILVKPEQDLEKLKYVFGPFRDEDIQYLKTRALEAKRIAEEHRALQVGGWKGFVEPGFHTDAGVMGFDCMAWLSGYEEIMALSLTNSEIIKAYANIILEWNLKQIEIYLDVTDADIIWRRAWYETTEFWTPNTYRQLVAPVLKREVDLVHQGGKKYGYIITSAFLPIIDDILDTGIDVLIGLDPKEGKGTDLSIVKRKFMDKRRTVWGGVSGAVKVEMGTEMQTRQAVKQAVDILGDGGGLILSPVDNVREDTENAWRNTRAFVDAWKEYRHPNHARGAHGTCAFSSSSIPPRSGNIHQGAVL